MAGPLRRGTGHFCPFPGKEGGFGGAGDEGMDSSAGGLGGREFCEEL